MRFQPLLSLFALVVLLASCAGEGNKFTVIGDIEGMPEQGVVLEELKMKEPVVIDSVVSNEKGHFELDGRAPEPGLYRLRFMNDPQKLVILSIDNGTVKVEGNWNRLENYEVAGSAPSASLRRFMLTIRQHINDFQTISVVMDSLQAQGKDSLLQMARKDVQEMNQDFTRYIEQYADTTAYLPNAIFAARMLNPMAEKDFLTAFIQSLPARFPESQNTVQEFSTEYNDVMAMQSQQQMPNNALAVGAKAPNISLPTPDGKEVSLQSLEGKYVLVDFWASWCGPCRRENPNVVAAYKKFKSKNFTILGVSLDEDKEKWQQAIKKDNLTWTHISDLKGWESAAARDYAVEAIPTNFLIDPQGNIIARDLRGQELENKLAELLQ